eukprot:403373008
MANCINTKNGNQQEIIEKFKQVKKVVCKQRDEILKYSIPINRQLTNRIEKVSNSDIKLQNFVELNSDSSSQAENLWNHITQRKNMEANSANSNKGLQFTYESKNSQPENSQKDLQVFFQQVKTGSKCFTVTTIRDMSLWSALERQTNLSKYKTIAFAQAAHEFRNPLNAIVNSIEILKDFIHDETAKKYYSCVKNCSNLMGFLINDFLDCCQIESKKFLLNNEMTSIHQIFDDCLNILNFKAVQKNLNFSFEISENFPTKIAIDQNRLRQILINLLSNAIKYTNKGFVKFTAQVQDIQKQTFQIIIEDSGVGIEQSEIKCLFTAFNKIIRKREMNKEGCGLGLTICQKLLKALGGEIHVESEVNMGSKFSISLPLILNLQESSSFENIDLNNTNRSINQNERLISEEQENPTKNATPFNLAKEQSTFKNERTYNEMLNIDDDPFNIIALEGMLNIQGILNIDKAYDGRDAFQKFTNNFNAISCNNPELHNPYQLVMLDNQMPLLTGIEVAQKIRETYEVDQHLKLVLLSM